MSVDGFAWSLPHWFVCACAFADSCTVGEVMISNGGGGGGPDFV